MSTKIKEFIAAAIIVAVAAFIALFPAWLMRSKGAHYAPTAAAAVAQPMSLTESVNLWFGVGRLPSHHDRHAAEDRLAYTLIGLAYTCQKVGLTKDQCNREYDEAMQRVR